MTARRSWFRFWIDGRTSKFAHSLAIEWTEKRDGQGIAACDVNPYEHTPDPLAVGFVPANEDAARCPACLEVVEGKVAA
jgi:hypothetical protein